MEKTYNKVSFIPKMAAPSVVAAAQALPLGENLRDLTLFKKKVRINISQQKNLLNLELGVTFHIIGFLGTR